MEKAYRLLTWLTVAQATNWLRQLTDTTLSHDDFMQVCEATRTPVYLNCQGWNGTTEARSNQGEITETLVTGAGYCAIEHPSNVYEDGPLALIGPVVVGANSKNTEQCYWLLPDYDESRRPELMPADIEVLAAKMNGVAAEIVEIEELRSQLEHERASRKQAEAELFKRRAEDGSNNLEKMRLVLNHDHAEFSAMQRRAENAEMLAASTDRQLAELSERNQSNTLLIAKLTERLGQHQESEPSSAQAEMTTTGLTFPYATKHLEAMQEAAIKHWADHDRSKPAPYGIQKAVQNFLAERTGENSRKVAELAAAIKPDDLPKS